MQRDASVLGVWVDNDIQAALKKYAKDNGYSISELVQFAIIEFLKARE